MRQAIIVRNILVRADDANVDRSYCIRKPRRAAAGRRTISLIDYS